MKIRTLLTLLLSVLLLAAVAAAKKPAGKISDLAAFSQIHSYCVDSEDMPGDEALDLKNFVTAESKPKKLLSKLPWTLAPDCSPNSPDAVIKVEFSKYFPVSESQVGAQLRVMVQRRRSSTKSEPYCGCRRRGHRQRSTKLRRLHSAIH